MKLSEVLKKMLSEIQDSDPEVKATFVSFCTEDDEISSLPWTTNCQITDYINYVLNGFFVEISNAELSNDLYIIKQESPEAYKEIIENIERNHLNCIDIEKIKNAIEDFEKIDLDYEEEIESDISKIIQ